MAETSVSYKCPSCGAPLSFRPGEDHVSCEFCGGSFTVEAIEELFAKEQEQAAKAAAAKEAAADELQWNTEGAGADWGSEEAAMMKAFTCSSCGAEIVCDGNTMVTECCYCGNPTMLPSRFDGVLKPDFVIPFKKTKEDAVAALKNFYKGKLLLPNAFTANNRVEDIQGMYVPFWLFDSTVSAGGTFSAETVAELVTEDEIITTTSVYSCSRAGEMSFRAVPVDGSERMDDTYMESIEPFDYSEMVPFTTAYLTGYLADKYDVTAENAAPRADQRVYNSALSCLESTVTGYDRVVADGDFNIVKSSADVKYAMAPVWILTTKYNGVPYTFMMNGQTGKFVGKLPIDNNKLNMYTAGIFAVTAFIIYWIAKFMLV